MPDKMDVKVLKNEFAAYTLLMVTHRPEMAMAYDRVVVMDAGMVVEDGIPEELLRNESGWLWEGGSSD